MSWTTSLMNSLYPTKYRIQTKKSHGAPFEKRVNVKKAHLPCENQSTSENAMQI
jgi:hypothetical protein